ncbi:hypothetical protein [Nocardia suismassiliense]|uniref:hypothetical protein n=1 Tax=Nocardia suismassiliense TaxID=2077092 RepID=UPI001F3741B7|nr:hypothetical protein [Nocardia suismassiliense]
MLDPYRCGAGGFPLEAITTRLARILTDHHPDTIEAVVIDYHQLGHDAAAHAITR